MPDIVDNWKTPLTGIADNWKTAAPSAIADTPAPQSTTQAPSPEEQARLTHSAPVPNSALNPEMGTAERYANVVKQGLDKGIAGTLGLPALAANFIRGKTGYEEPSAFPTGEKIYNTLFKPPDGTEVTPSGLGENIAGAVGEMVGGNVIPGFGIAAKAKSLSAIGPMLKVATGAGIGSGIARTVAPDSIAADIIGGIGGGLATGFSPTGILKRVTSPFTKEGIKNAAAKEFASGVTEEGVFNDQLAKTRALQEEIPGTKYLTGQATNEPNIITQTRSEITGGGNKPLRSAALEGKSQTNQALEKYGQEILPGLSDENIVATRNKVFGEIGKAENTVNAATAPFFGIDRQSAGSNIYAEMKTARGNKYNEVKDMYDEIGKQNPSLDATDIMDTVDSISKPHNEFENTANIPMDIINRVKQYFKPSEAIDTGILDAKGNPIIKDQIANTDINFNDLRGLRTEIKNSIRQEQGDVAPNGAKIDRLKSLDQSVSRTLDSLGGRNDELGNLYKTASDKYRTEYLPYKQGAAADIQQRGSRGELNKVDTEDIGSKFLRGATQADDFIKTLGNRPAAIKSLYDTSVKEMLDSATDENGKLITRKVYGWVKARQEALDKFPGLKNKILSIAEAQKSVDKLAKTRLFFEDADGVRDIDKIVPSILSSRNPARSISKIIDLVKDDPQALNGLRRSAWENALDRSGGRARDALTGEEMIQTGKLNDFVKRNAGVFDKLYTPEELKKMATLRKGYEIMQRGDRSVLGGGSDTNEKLSNRLAGDAAKIFLDTAIGGKFWITNKAVQIVKNTAQWFTKGEKQKLLNEALINPDVAEEFLKMSKGLSNPKIITGKLHSFLANIPALAAKAEKPSTAEDYLKSIGHGQ